MQIIGLSEVQAPSYVEQVTTELCQSNIHVSIDKRNEKISRKIRDVQVQKIPYVLMLGDGQQNTGNVSVRAFKQEGLQSYRLQAFMGKMLAEILEKKLP